MFYNSLNIFCINNFIFNNIVLFTYCTEHRAHVKFCTSLHRVPAKHLSSIPYRFCTKTSFSTFVSIHTFSSTAITYITNTCNILKYMCTICTVHNIHRYHTWNHHHQKIEDAHIFFFINLKYNQYVTPFCSARKRNWNEITWTRFNLSTKPIHEQNIKYGKKVMMLFTLFED